MPRRPSIRIATLAAALLACAASAADVVPQIQAGYWQTVAGEEEAGSSPRVAALPPAEDYYGGDAYGATNEYDLVFDDATGDVHSTDPWNDPVVRLSDYKAGFFQKLFFSAAWIPGDSGVDLGITELKSYGSVALPLPTRDHPLLISPSFEARFLSGPSLPDVPPRLYSSYLQLLWVPQITSRLSAVLGFIPGYYSDWEDFDADAIRLQGLGLLRYDVIPDRLQLLAGAAYLDRPDFKVLPAGGVLWYPTENLRLDLLVPYPKIAYRLTFDGVVERWIYTAGEIGGDAWSVRRIGGESDVLTLRDLRLILGYEKKRDGGRGWRAEIGYLFGRQLQYLSAAGSVHFDDTLMLRGTVAF